MPENTGEQLLKQERIITLGQTFHPFDPKYTEEKMYEGLGVVDHSFKPIRTIIDLDLGAFKLPLEIMIFEHPELRVASIITPFDPSEEGGYAITNADFNLEERKQKAKQLDDYFVDDSTLLGMGIETFDPSGKLSSFLDPETLNNSMPGLSSKLKKLKVQVKAGSGSYEAKGQEISSFSDDPDNGIAFLYYYPLDTGPLPTAKRSRLKEGFDLVFPNDPKKLASIEMKFVLAKNPNEQDESNEPVQL